MSTNFNPTHRTNRAIGQIKAGSPIRVARYDGSGYFSDLLMELGETAYHLGFQYYGNAVQVWDPKDLNRTSRYVLPDDYVITDGEHFEVSDTDSGWDLLSAPKVSGTEDVIITLHGTYYSIYGKESGTTLRMTPKDILSLADRIKENVPKPSPIADAMFIWGTPRTGPSEPLVRDGDFWYDCANVAYTEDEVLELYTDLGVIR